MLSKKPASFFMLFSLLTVTVLSAQDFAISPQKISTRIHLDGILNEVPWQAADVATNFQMNYPYDSLRASSKTEVSILYDDQNIYIGAICFNSRKANYVIQSLKRDFDFWENDAFLIFLDPLNESINGLTFGVNPKGVQLEGTVPRGGVKGLSLNWDAEWFAEVHQDEGGDFWSIEMKIPLNLIRFSSNNMNWGINFCRNDLMRNEVSTWSPIARGFNIATLAQNGQLAWQNLPPVQDAKITVIPYVATGVDKSFEQEDVANITPKIGLDAKINLTSSLKFDFTVNPDFSQVEVDQQVINLDRFELFFPEKRFLFLENSDLFSGLGNSRVRPYFSRRIGSAGSNAVPIYFGGRLSGNIGEDWQVDLMTVHTGQVEGLGKANQNYSIAAIRKTILDGSSLTAFISNRQSVDDFYIDDTNFSRIGGVELDYRSPNSTWIGKAFVHFSSANRKNNNGLAYSGKIRYKTTKASLFFGVDAVGEKFETDMGYIPHLYHSYRDSVFRVPYLQFRSNGYYRFFGKKESLIDFFMARFSLNYFLNPNSLDYQEHDMNLKGVIRFLNQNEITFGYAHYSPKLFFPFWLDGLSSAIEAGNYPNNRFSIKFNSGKLKRLYWQSYIGFGGEYSGNRFDFRGEMNYRFQHFISGGLSFSQQNLSGFPDGYGEAQFTLVGSKFEVSFNRNLFFTTFLQYNTQLNNFNINSRFNWRFRPMSDLYLVYTENYSTGDLSVKDRALVMKLNYWLSF